MIHLTFKDGGGVVRINTALIAMYHSDYRVKATRVTLLNGDGYYVVETPEEIDELLEDR